MNKIKGQIQHIDTDDQLSIVTLKVEDYSMKAIIIETPDTVDYLEIGKSVFIVFKATEVSIGKHIGQVSLQNQLPCTITNITKSRLLSALELQCNQITLQSIITTAAVEQLDLKITENVIALIKTNEVMLAPITSF